ncbi:MAG: lytic transglycosylase domain-containing protein [Candidatus Margulisiibacteriota bacterium]
MLPKKVVLLSGFLWLILLIPCHGQPLPSALISSENAEVSPNTAVSTPPPFTVDASSQKAIVAYIQQHHRNVPLGEAQEIAKHIILQSEKQDIDPMFTAAVISAESGFNRKAVSRSGAKGLGQLTPPTYRHLNVTNPFDIEQNVTATTVYLGNLLDMWKNSAQQETLALASYLRGYVRIKRSGGKLDRFASRYTQEVLRRYNELKNKHQQFETAEAATPSSPSIQSKK